MLAPKTASAIVPAAAAFGTVIQCGPLESMAESHVPVAAPTQWCGRHNLNQSDKERMTVPPYKNPTALYGSVAPASSRPQRSFHEGGKYLIGRIVYLQTQHQ